MCDPKHGIVGENGFIVGLPWRKYCVTVFNYMLFIVFLLSCTIDSMLFSRCTLTVGLQKI